MRHRKCDVMALPPVAVRRNAPLGRRVEAVSADVIAIGGRKAYGRFRETSEGAVRLLHDFVHLALRQNVRVFAYCSKVADVAGVEVDAIVHVAHE